MTATSSQLAMAPWRGKSERLILCCTLVMLFQQHRVQSVIVSLFTFPQDAAKDGQCVEQRAGGGTS